MPRREFLVGQPLPPQVVTVLVVDDEPIARRVAFRILSEEGYRVFEAADADEALHVLTHARGRGDLAVLDVVMPGSDGVELASEIMSEWPDQRILFMSGTSGRGAGATWTRRSQRTLSREAVHPQ